MKTISLKLQRILMWIPGGNVLNLPIWFYNSFYWDKKEKTLPRTLSILFTTAIPLVTFAALILTCLPRLAVLAEILTGYLLPLLLSYRLIRYQEELMK